MNSIFPALLLLSQGMFFENTKRLTLLPQDPLASSIVRVLHQKPDGRQGRCTGFFVASQSARFLVGSARHCFNYDVEAACAQKRILVETAGEGAYQGQCKKVLISDVRDDFTIFEVDFNRENLRVAQAISPLKLAANAYPVGTRLQMMGYPGDPEQNGALTLSSNCWIQGAESISFWDALSSEGREGVSLALSEHRLRSPADPAIEEFRKKLSRPLGRHNCSVYGGNSGGPLVVEGAGVVVGIPAAYYPGYFNPSPENTYSPFDDLAAFVTRYWEQVELNGIEVKFYEPDPL